MRDKPSKSAEAGGVMENKHSTEVESPPPPPRVYISIGGVLRTSSRPTLNLLLLLRAVI
jgi:hypothetical protein